MEGFKQSANCRRGCFQREVAVNWRKWRASMSWRKWHAAINQKKRQSATGGTKSPVGNTRHYKKGQGSEGRLEQEEVTGHYELEARNKAVGGIKVMFKQRIKDLIVASCIS